MARFEHHPNAVLHPEEHPPQVDIHGAVEVRHRHIGQHHSLGDAGHVEYGVKAAEFLHRRSHHRLHIFLAAHVAADGQHAIAYLCRSLFLGSADVARYHSGAFTREYLR